MANVTITLNTKQARGAFAQLRQRAPIAIARALNRAGRSARTVMVRECARDLGLQQKAIRDQFTTGEATKDRQAFYLSTTGRRIPLIAFKARQTKSGVSYRLPGGAGHNPNAFIATVTGPLPSGVVSPGHRGVFVRKGKARLPIRQLFGPSLPHVFAKYLPVGQARGLEALAKNLQSEIKYELSQIGKSI